MNTKLNNKSFAFTLIEILVVATIIGVLASAIAISYSQFSKQSRDAKRKTDLENIRAALEMYRSNNASSSYPLTADLNFTCANPGSIIDTSLDPDVTYLTTIPTDPKCSDFKYYYESDGTTYIMSAQLEATDPGCSSGSGTDRCGTGLDCNYCLGPYGQL